MLISYHIIKRRHNPEDDHKSELNLGNNRTKDVKVHLDA